MASPDEWGKAYAEQAGADFDTYNYLQGSELPECQRLHFLQMACEKVTKAHLAKAGTAPADLQTSHAYTAKTLPVVLREQLTHFGVKDSVGRDVMRAVRHFSREVSRLCPSVDADNRPDNCEYPWEDQRGKIHVPARYAFTPSQLLQQRHGRTILKLVQAAIARLIE